MKTVALRIDAKNSMKLVTGKPVAFRVPKDAEVIELQLSHERDNSTMAKIIDVFFNGRPA